MILPRRMERAPYYLVAADLLLAACAAVAALPVGPAQVLAPLCIVVVVYASGDYSLLAEFRSRARLGVPFVCVAFLAAAGVLATAPAASWMFRGTMAVRLGVAGGACALFAATHFGLERLLRRTSQRLVLHLGAGRDVAAQALQRHLDRSRYPAVVMTDQGTDAGHPSDGTRVPDTAADIVRFCEVSLRVLPPAVLALDRSYARWRQLGPKPYDPLKRAVDVAAASVLILLGLPFMAFAAVGIRLTSGAPVLFRQVRVGLFGKRFSLVKFRTLEGTVPSEGNPNHGIEARAFRFGSLLRRTRLDELPQLFNVLRGDMSMVGPRPEMEFFHRKCVREIPFYRQRLTVRPGLSGWAQVRFRHTSTENDYCDKTAYDLWYIRHRGPVVDVRILLRTVGVMLFGFGAR